MISTKGRYAIRVMIDLAEHDGGCIPLKDIAARQQLSKILRIQLRMLRSSNGWKAR